MKSGKGQKMKPKTQHVDAGKKPKKSKRDLSDKLSSDASPKLRRKKSKDKVKSRIVQSIGQQTDSSDFQFPSLYPINSVKLPSASNFQLERYASDLKKMKKSILPVESRTSSSKKRGLMTREEAYHINQRVILKNEAFKVNELLSESTEDLDFSSVIFEESYDDVTRKNEHEIQKKMKKKAVKLSKGYKRYLGSEALHRSESSRTTKVESPSVIEKESITKIDSKEEEIVEMKKIDSKKEEIVEMKKIDSKKEEIVEMKKIDSKKEEIGEMKKIDSKKEKIVEMKKIDSKKEEIVEMKQIDSKKEIVGMKKIDSKKGEIVEMKKIDSKKEEIVEMKKIDSKEGEIGEMKKIDSKKEEIGEMKKIDSKKEEIVEMKKIDSKEEEIVEIKKIDSKEEEIVKKEKMESKEERIVKEKDIKKDEEIKGEKVLGVPSIIKSKSTGEILTEGKLGAKIEVKDAASKPDAIVKEISKIEIEKQLSAKTLGKSKSMMLDADKEEFRKVTEVLKDDKQLSKIRSKIEAQEQEKLVESGKISKIMEQKSLSAEEIEKLMKQESLLSQDKQKLESLSPEEFQKLIEQRLLIHKEHKTSESIASVPSHPELYSTERLSKLEPPKIFITSAKPEKLGEPATLVSKKSSQFFVPKSSRLGLLPKKIKKRRVSQKLSPFSPFFALNRLTSEVSVSSSSSEDRTKPHPSGLSFSSFCFLYKHYRVPDEDVTCCCETKRSLVELQKKSCLDLCASDVDRRYVHHPTGLTFSEYKVIMA